MLILKILCWAVSAALFWVGGKWNHNARRFAMPFLLAVFSLFITLDWWTLTMLATMGIFCMGYGEDSPLRHIFGDAWGRGVWGLLAGITLSTGLFFSGHLHLYFYLPYLALNFTLEPALRKLPQDIGDPLIGAGFGSIVFLI